MAEKIKQLKPIDLTYFVYKVQELCPKAITDSNPKTLQIKMNQIEKTTFNKLLGVLEEKVDNKKFKEE